ncbi:MAG: hypothetical protein KDB27_08630 [Planctomycetales bacterium]|nr:hypothetical protein [Planctomycetales bacterium]
MKTFRTRKSHKNRISVRRGQNFESLESRQLMASDVSFAVSDPLVTETDLTAEVIPESSSLESGSLTSSESRSTSRDFSSATATVNAMKAMAVAGGEIVLDQFDQLATFAGITIAAPTFSSDGSVTGTTQFGNTDAPVLLQFVPQTGDWVLAVESRLGELLPSDLPISSPIELQSPLFVFSPAQLQIDAADMADGPREFYSRLYDSEDFTVRLERGVNLLSRATLTEGSAPSEILDLLGVDVPSIELEGVILRDFSSDSVEEFKQANKDGNFWSRFREDMLLRATLPEINIEGLPGNMTTGDAYLAWQSPGTDQDYVYAGLDLIVDDGDGVPTILTGRVGFAETPTGSELRLSAVASQMNDAFGVTGLDLHEVVLLLDIDTVKSPAEAGAKSTDPTAAVPTVGLGVSASMTIGNRDVMIAGKVELSMATGTPMKVALRGELSSLSSIELLQFANQMSGVSSLSVDTSNLPEIEFRNLMVNIAPMGGDAELGIEDGIGIRGELYLNGRLLGKVDGLLDRTGVLPKMRLSAWTAEINLGELRVSEVEIDVLMSQSVDDYFIVNGTVELFGASHSVEINIGARYMHYQIATEVDGLGMVDYRFESSTLGVPYWTFTAVVRNDLSHTLEEKVAGDVRDWANEASRDFDRAQAAVDAAQRELNSVVEERNDAIRDAQQEFDKIKDGLQKAEDAVDSLARRVSSLQTSERSARSSWLSAVRSRKAATWYNYVQRRAVEVARYATYRGIQVTRIAAQGSLTAASGVLTGLRHAAGWALDAAGPEAHPNVIRLSAELAIKTAALNVAEAALNIAEGATTGAAEAVAFIAERHDDLFMIDELSFEGTLSAAIVNSSFDLEVSYRFLNKQRTIEIEAGLDLDFDELAGEILGRIREIGNA